MKKIFILIVIVIILLVGNIIVYYKNNQENHIEAEKIYVTQESMDTIWCETFRISMG